MFATSKKPLRTADSNTLAGQVGIHGKQRADDIPRRYPHKLSFYNVPPLAEMTVEDFEVWGIDRLRVLAEIEACQARNRTYDDTRNVILALCKKYLNLSNNTAKGIDTDAERKKDHYGHFVLRLAFCRSEELRSRFVKAESTLFRIRYDDTNQDEREAFLAELKIDLDVVDNDTKTKLKDELLTCLPAKDREALNKNDNFLREAFYKVHWTRVAELVERRRVFLSGGYAYVPSKEQLSLIVAEFSRRLTHALEMTARALPRLDEDDRLVPILDHLSQGFLAGVSSEYTSPTDESGETIRAEHVDELARKHFPMCMRNLHDNLKKDKHLRHFGRQQYNLFLKGIGLSVEEALIFWRKSFSSMTDDKFNKEYRYNIRHNYGLEGKRHNYTPKSCQQIILRDQPGALDSHGCPFRHFSATALSTALATTYRVPPTTQEHKEILDAVKNNHFHVACTRLFEVTHADKGVKKGDGVGQGESITHPNRYFDASRKLDTDRQAAAGGTDGASGSGSAVKAEAMEVDS